MDVQLYQEVALTMPVAEFALKRGDVAMLVDIVPHPAGGEDGYVLEFFNAIDESLFVTTVPRSSVEPLHANEILSVRTLVRAA